MGQPYTKFEMFQSIDRAQVMAGKAYNAPAGGIKAGVIYGPFGHRCQISVVDLTAAQVAAGEKAYTAIFAHPDVLVKCQGDDTFNEGESVYATGGVVVNEAAAANLPMVGMVLEYKAAGDAGDVITNWVRIAFNGVNCRELDGTMNYA